MIKLLLLILTLNISYSNVILEHSMMEQILSNKPRIDKDYAKKLQKALLSSCIKYDIPCHIYNAMLFQESSYRLNCIATSVGLYKGNRTVVGLDYGISQINWRNVLKLKLDVDRLTTDMVYSVNQGAIILANFKKRYAHKEKYWWVRYNCGTGSIKKKTCNDYKTRVLRYL